ncbi:carbohydrate ABC transporter permease [Psychromicrobium xiongbiense]|uniref:carbohydrate ABC transporter permease n=1 Tax=Psychromicrobium xiongbiense TaxID=3051184 RepID=UPI00255607E2|nr:carbohydrate ABC transporter permease [Psychromicrobium sp. YIM S02556]
MTLLPTAPSADAGTLRQLPSPRAADPQPRSTMRRIREPRADRFLNVILLIVLGILSLSILYPLLFVLSASFSDPSAVSSGQVTLWPVGFSVDAYQAIFQYPLIFQGLLNSLLYAVVLTIIATCATIAGGYALSRTDLPGRRLLMMVFVFTMFFSGGMIPSYLVVKSLGMLNTPWAMILPGAMSVWQLIVTRTYFQVNVPQELLECSRIDGASDARFFFQVVIPLSKPIIAVNVLLFAVGSWNSYFNGLIYLTDEHLYSLPMVMRDILLQNSFDPSRMASADPAQVEKLKRIADQLKYALIVVASIPPLLIYPFVQKHFVKGMMVGSLKG